MRQPRRESSRFFSDDELIDRHIEPNPYKSGPSEARLVDSGVSVWAIIMNYYAVNGDASFYYKGDTGALNAMLMRFAAGGKGREVVLQHQGAGNVAAQPRPHLVQQGPRVGRGRRGGHRAGGR